MQSACGMRSPRSGRVDERRVVRHHDQRTRRASRSRALEAHAADADRAHVAHEEPVAARDPALRPKVEALGVPGQPARDRERDREHRASPEEEREGRAGAHDAPAARERGPAWRRRISTRARAIPGRRCVARAGGRRVDSAAVDGGRSAALLAARAPRARLRLPPRPARLRGRAATPRDGVPARLRAGRRLRRRSSRTSHYVTMRDGVRIAVDVILPRGPAARRASPPCSTRAATGAPSRSADRRASSPTRRRVTATSAASRPTSCAAATRGSTSIRAGSGASVGTRLWDYSPEEILDGADLADWIVAQPWSDGRVAGVGVSYSGAAAELLLANAHPRREGRGAALLRLRPVPGHPRARRHPAPLVDPRVGRLHPRGSTAACCPRSSGSCGRSSAGVRPWPGAAARAPRPRSREHRGNFDFAAMADVVYRDDRPAASFARDAARRPRGRRRRGLARGALRTRVERARHRPREPARLRGRRSTRPARPVYAYSGWLDGGYARAAARPLRDAPRSAEPPPPRAVGPRATGGEPARRARPLALRPSRASCCASSTQHVKGLRDRARARAARPLLHDRRGGVARGRSLAAARHAGALVRRGRRARAGAAAATARTPTRGLRRRHGAASRWGALRGRPIGAPYPDRAEQDARLLPTPRRRCPPLEVTGHPVVTLQSPRWRTHGRSRCPSSPPRPGLG